MKKNLIETVMGAVVLLVAAFFVVTAYKSSGVAKESGYTVTARFQQIDGVGVGSDVRIGGFKVGTVIAQDLDATSYQVILSLSLKQGISLPTDTTAAIVSESLLGGKYISLTPGAEEEILAEGGEIAYTQSSVNIEQLIGKYAFGSAETAPSQTETEE